MKVFIINPVAGRGVANNISKKLEEIKENDWILEYTKNTTDATKLAKKYKNKAKIIYSVGGDGTLNEVVNGMIGGSAILGVIPGGSGNDFYKTIKNFNKPLEIDLGEVNKRYFINVASVGIDAEIAKNANYLKNKHINFKQIYNLSILYTFFRYKMASLSINNAEFKKYTLLTACNGIYYGDGFKISPHSKLNDDILDVYTIKKVNKLKIIRALLKLLKGEHDELDYVKHLKVNSVKVKSKSVIPCNFDGEIFFDKNFEFKVSRHRITVLNDKKLINKIIV